MSTEISDYKEGTRVRRLGPARASIPEGTEGVVKRVTNRTVYVTWDGHVTRNTNYDPRDKRIEIIAPPAPPYEPLFVGDSGWRA